MNCSHHSHYDNQLLKDYLEQMKCLKKQYQENIRLETSNFTAFSTRLIENNRECNFKNTQFLKFMVDTLNSFSSFDASTDFNDHGNVIDSLSVSTNERIVDALDQVIEDSSTLEQFNSNVEKLKSTLFETS